jgi:hypothetical protein
MFHLRLRFGGYLPSNSQFLPRHRRAMEANGASLAGSGGFSVTGAAADPPF